LLIYTHLIAKSFRLAQKSSKYSSTMSVIGKNIKKIRVVKKLSQAAFAEIFHLARPSVGAYEEERSEPKIDTIIQMAAYFGISVDSLLTKELTINELYKFDIYHDINKEAGDRRKKQSVVNNKVPMIKINDYVEYIVNFENKDYLESKKEIVPPFEVNRNAIAFELNGSEMEYNHNGLHHGDILFGRIIDKFESNLLKEGAIYVIVSKSAISTRRLMNKGKLLSFSSDDPNYPELVIETQKVLQLIEVEGAYSNYLNPPKMIDERVLRLENEMDILRKQVNGL